MAEGERDSTQDWLLPEGSAPPTLAQLERKVDFAIAVARASEAAAVEIGAAALDAAEQARRAAELAELASRGGATPAPLSGGAIEVGVEKAADLEPEPAFDSFTNFLERAEHVSARLEAIARV